MVDRYFDKGEWYIPGGGDTPDWNEFFEKGDDEDV